MHLILRHKSPKTGKVEEKHLKSPPFVETDTKTHVYTAILRASNNRWDGCGWACGASAAAHTLAKRPNSRRQPQLNTGCCACGWPQLAWLIRWQGLNAD